MSTCSMDKADVARERLEGCLRSWGHNQLVPVRTEDLRELLAATSPEPEPQLTEDDIREGQAMAERVMKRAEAIRAVHKELMMAPMKSNFTFSRDELIALIGLPRTAPE